MVRFGTFDNSFVPRYVNGETQTDLNFSLYLFSFRIGLGVNERREKKNAFFPFPERMADGHLNFIADVYFYFSQNASLVA